MCGYMAELCPSVWCDIGLVPRPLQYASGNQNRKEPQYVAKKSTLIWKLIAIAKHINWLMNIRNEAESTHMETEWKHRVGFWKCTLIASPLIIPSLLITCFYMQAVKNQYDSSYHVAAPVQFKFNSHGDGHSDSICINFERYPTGGWVLSKNTGQVIIMHS